MNAIKPIEAVNKQSAVAPRTQPYVIKRGDTLSRIVRDHLIAQRRDHSPQAVHKAVQTIARDNNVKNPDLIFPGQRIQLNELSSKQSPTFSEALSSIGRAQLHSDARSSVNKVLEGEVQVTSPFGLRKHPITHDHRHHNGVDLKAKRNSPITPLRSGTVVFSGWNRGHGNTIIIRHEDGMETQYSHASKRLVSKGDRVQADTVVGLVGSTGNSTGPHLHFEVKSRGRHVNPMPFLRNEDSVRSRIHYSSSSSSPT